MSNQRGDAFYKDNCDDWATTTAYSTGQGLLIDGADISPRPEFEANHRYSFTISGTGTSFAFSWIDPDGSYSENENKQLKIRICRVA